MKKLFTILSILALTSCLFVSCSDNNEPENVSITARYKGDFKGTATLSVAGKYDYKAEIVCRVTSSDDETLTVVFPEYSLEGTMMGDITLGELTISGLVYDEEKGGFFRSYGGEGLSRHLTAMQNGHVTMDKDYPLNDPSSILVTAGDDGMLSIDNPFTLGAMPLPMTVTFNGVR